MRKNKKIILFDKVKESLQRALKFNSESDIKSANELLQRVYVNEKTNEIDAHDSLIDFDRKTLVCLKYFGKIPCHFNFFRMDFIKFVEKNDFYLENGFYYWQEVYYEFLRVIKRQPDKDDLLIFEGLDEETKVKLIIKYDNKHTKT